MRLVRLRAAGRQNQFQDLAHDSGASGNPHLYRGQAPGILGGIQHNAILANLGTNGLLYANQGYSKQAGNNDWSDLATYGLYCLEALVRAAVLKVGLVPKTTHWEKVDQAKILTRKHKLPDISRLLKDLNVIRKANAYGDSEFDESDFDADKIAADIEDYYKRVSKFSK